MESVGVFLIRLKEASKMKSIRMMRKRRRIYFGHYMLDQPVLLLT